MRCAAMLCYVAYSCFSPAVVVASEAVGDPLFEANATLPPTSQYKREAVISLAHTAVAMIKAADYSCTTISAVLADPFNNTFTFFCDHHRYEYEFRDLGGHIQISIGGRVISFQ